MPKPIKYCIIKLTTILLICITIGCKYSNKQLHINLKANEELENKFISSHDTIYLNHILDSVKGISPQTHATKVLFYYLQYIKEHYTNNYYENYANAEILQDYLEKNKLTQVYSKYYSDALFAKGEYYFAAAKYDEALKEYYAAKNILDLQKDTCNYSKFYNKLWNFYYYKKEYDKALEYLNISLINEYNCKGNTSDYLYYHRVQATLNTKALCFEKLGKYDSAIFIYKQGIAFLSQPVYANIIQPQKIEIALGIYYGNLGGSFAYNHQSDSAILYLNKSIAINSKPGYDSIDLQTAYLKLVEIYLNQKKYDKARAILDQTNHLINSSNHPTNGSTRSKWHLLNYNYYTLTGKLENAIKAYQNFFHVQDSVNKTAYALNNFSISREMSKIKNEFSLNDAQKKSEIKTIYIVVFSIVLVLLTFIIILILRYLKQVKILSNQTALHNLQLQSTLQQFEQSNQNYAHVMKVMAHDLRSPLAGITGITELLLTDASMIEEEKKQMLHLIQSSCNNSLNMISELLNSSTSLEVKEIDKKEMDIISLLRQCVDLLKFKANEKNITIFFHHDIDKILLSADNEKLWRLFSNLIMNAIKFSENNKAIYLYVEKYMNEVVINIQDEGIGIPENLKNTVFDMFTSARRKGTAGEQPFGIGLHTCKQIVEAHKGRIWFISNEPIGTSFYVALPIN